MTFDARKEAHGVFDHCNHPATDHGAVCNAIVRALERAYNSGRADAATQDGGPGEVRAARAHGMKAAAQTVRLVLMNCGPDMSADMWHAALSSLIETLESEASEVLVAPAVAP